MAGTIIADKIQTENAFLTLNVGQTLVATINSSGILNSSGGTMIGANGSVSNTAITGVITASQLATSLNLATNNVQVASIQTATGTPAITFAANGQITTANAPFILTGGQLQFPATQIASGDGNCLDDYEEGTWTATLTGSTTAPSSPVTTTGNYTKIGNLVTVFFRFTNVNTTGASGNMYISGLPFTSATSVEQQSAVPMMYGLNITGSYITGYIGQNQTIINFLGIQNNGAWIDVTITAGSAKYMNMSITYRAL